MSISLKLLLKSKYDEKINNKNFLKDNILKT